MKSLAVQRAQIDELQRASAENDAVEGLKQGDEDDQAFLSWKLASPRGDPAHRRADWPLCERPLMSRLLRFKESTTAKRNSQLPMLQGEEPTLSPNPVASWGRCVRLLCAEGWTVVGVDNDLRRKLCCARITFPVLANSDWPAPVPSRTRWIFATARRCAIFSSSIALTSSFILPATVA